MITKTGQLAAGLVGLCVSAQAFSASDLIISEYIEGSSNNKAIELYNGTDQTIDLSAYELITYSNGSADPGLVLNLTGQVEAGDVYVIAHSSADTAILTQADFTSGAGMFNGDDAITLLNGGVVVDSIGQVGFDPGSQWGSGDVGTQNNTLRRLVAVEEGDSNPDDIFDPSAEWEGFGQDVFDGLGAHVGNGNGGGGEPSAPELGACGDAATLISAVQGSGFDSPLEGETVIVEAQVSGLRVNGFFIQEEPSDEDGNDLTSEGVFVFADTNLEVGERVRVIGEVDEYFGLTELTNVSDWQSCEGSVELTETQLSLPLAEGESLEPYEAMLVAVTDLTVFDINNLWRYGEIGLSHELKRAPTDRYAPTTPKYYALIEANAANQIYVEDDLSARFPELLSFYPDFSYANPIRVGDKVSTVGPLNYSFGLYRINPLEPINVVGERPATPDLRRGNLTMASFNVLNYFNGTDDGSGGVTFDYPENRGAENLQEFELQEARIVEAIVSMDADVIGLMEIENDGFGEDSAIQSLVDAVNAKLRWRDRYRFIATADGAPVGSDAIAVGLLYRPAVVRPKRKAITIPMPIQTRDDGSLVQMRTALLQRFQHRRSRKPFAIVVNHFKSKGSGCWEDDNLSDEITTAQSSCNALRVSAAVTLGKALESYRLPRRVMIMGDLNSYSAEDPIAVLTDYDPVERGYTIMSAVNTDADNGQAVPVTDTFGYYSVAKLLDPIGFSYWFYQTAQVGSLDHILVNRAFKRNLVGATHWNINGVEAYQLQYDQALTFYPDADGYAFTDVGPYRSSDHDPFVVSFRMR